MKIQNEVTKAVFVNRPNRFVAYVMLNDEIIKVHVPNTGRCREILKEGTVVVLRKGNGSERKTPYDLIGAYKGDMFINIDSQIPNSVVDEALKNGAISSLKEYKIIRREKTFENSRFDFYLQKDISDKGYFLEIKGVTLEEDGIARFPDAPTERGSKHLIELIKAKNEGYGAGVLFLLQMKGPRIFMPHEKMDKKFAESLRIAEDNGVNIFAYDCILDEDFITLDKEIPYNLKKLL